MRKKIIILDLDGTLICSRELHTKALIKAFVELDIEVDFIRLRELEGTPTKTKLQILEIPENIREEAIALKNKYTSLYLDDLVSPYYDTLSAALLLPLTYGDPVFVCSNAIKSTVEKLLAKAIKPQVIKNLAGVYSNEDVEKPKPASEMFLKALQSLDESYYATPVYIIEDSFIGMSAACELGRFFPRTHTEASNKRRFEVIPCLTTSVEHTIKILGEIYR